MTWNYRVFRNTTEGMDSFEIHEVYYDESGRPHSYMESASQPFGDNVEELRAEIQYMLEALQHPILTAADFQRTGKKVDR